MRLASLLAAGCLWLASAQTITVGTNAGSARTVPGGFFGYNDQSATSLNRQDPNCLAAIGNVRAEVIRFPGGQNGNYWDWETGLPVTNYDTGISVGKNPFPRLLSSVPQQMSAQRATPIYMLNMLTDPECTPPVGGLCQYEPSSPNLNYQIQMLEAAQAVGLPVKYVELGNEYYLSSIDGYTGVYPDPSASTTYASLATQWIAAIKKQFPQAMVAAVGSNTTDTSGSREGSWNAGLFPALQGEDAITIHTYIRKAVTSGTLDDAAAEYMLGTPFTNWSKLETVIGKIPSNIPIWFTEFNLGDENYPVWGTWAHGLVTATMSMLFLEDPRVVVMAKHDLVSDGVFAEIFSSTSGFGSGAGGKYTLPPTPPPTTQWGRTAQNMTMAQIATAAGTATQTVSLTFPGAPTLSSGGTSYPALYGWSFQAGSTESAVVLNLSNQPLTIDVSGLGLSGGAYDQISGAPFTYVTGGLSGSPTNLTESTGTLAGKTCVLPAFSISRIRVTSPVKIGTYNAGQWLLDVNGNGTWDGDPPDLTASFGWAGATYITGDWNGDGRTKIGVYYNGFWYLDYDGNGIWDGGVKDKQYVFGWSDPNVIPVVGDWNHDGRTKIGVYYNGFWYLDYDGNGVWDGGVNDKAYNFGWPATGVTPVVGDWSGTGADKIGIYYNGFWYLDYLGNGIWDGGVNDKAYTFGWAAAGVTPLVGDWNGDGRKKIGIYYNGLWYLDYDGNGVWDGGVNDKAYSFGWSGVTPLTGDWSGSGTTKIGIYTGGYWYLDYNGNGTWDGPSADRGYIWGQSGDIPVVGAW
jgi:hypothetical protein